MKSRAALLLLVVGCTKQPRPTAEPVHDAAVDAGAVDSGVHAKAEAPGPASMFSLVARAPIGRIDQPEQGIASALPFVARLPNDGLIVVSEYGRAIASGAGPLVVTVSLDVPKDFEYDVYYRTGDIQGAQLLRWVWSDGQASVVSAENSTMRSGPEVGTNAYGPKGYWHVRRNAGYWDAVSRDGSVLALERVGYTIPNPMYAAPTTETASALKPGKVAVLTGTAASPIIPSGVCPINMAAGPDGTVLVVVDKCADEAGDSLGLLRYAPKATTAKLTWIKTTTPEPGNAALVAIAVASANEIYVGHGETIDTWDGKQWTASSPFEGDKVASLSAGVDGSLWAIARRRDDGGYLTVKKPGAAKWADVALPKIPATPLDDVAYSPADHVAGAFHKTEQPDLAERGEFTLRKVDAAGSEILVIGSPSGLADREVYIFSTKARGAVARIPSIETQRAELAKAFPRTTVALDAKSPKGCSSSFLMFPEGTKHEALGISPTDGGQGIAAGEATVEGATRLVVYAPVRYAEEELAAATKRLAPLSPKRVCGPPVIERDF